MATVNVPIVEFRSTKGAGMEGHGVYFPGVGFNQQDGSKGIVGGISLNNDGSVRNPMDQDRCRGEGRLQSFKGFLGSIGEIPWSALTGQLGQW